MDLGTSGLTKALIAVRASKWFLAGVRPNVRIEVALLDKALRAVWTSVRPLSGVRLDVIIQI